MAFFSLKVNWFTLNFTDRYHDFTDYFIINFVKDVHPNIININLKFGLNDSNVIQVIT